MLPKYLLSEPPACRTHLGLSLSQVLARVIVATAAGGESPMGKAGNTSGEDGCPMVKRIISDVAEVTATHTLAP
jgi:hypothetical protein